MIIVARVIFESARDILQNLKLPAMPARDILEKIIRDLFRLLVTFLKQAARNRLKCQLKFSK